MKQTSYTYGVSLATASESRCRVKEHTLIGQYVRDRVSVLSIVIRRATEECKYEAEYPLVIKNGDFNHVTDYERACKLIRNILVEHGYRVTFVTDGEFEKVETKTIKIFWSEK